jgi:hypothetical protein
MFFMGAIGLNSVVTRNDDIVAGVVDTDLIMMSIESGKYYQLNISAGRIWDILEQPRTVAELCNMLSKDFKVTSEGCQKDVLLFLEDLASRKIVTVR